MLLERVQWARSYAKLIGALESPKRGVFLITALGKELLALPDRPTAIFCGNDLMAMGAIEAAFERGLRVPEDLSIMGYDDQELARYTIPPLTTVLLPNYEMGQKAAELLVDSAIHGKKLRPMVMKIDGPLVLRSSVASRTTG